MSDNTEMTPIATAVASFTPRNETARKWRLADISDRNNALICVIKPNPKQPGSDAHLMYPYQGEPNEPTVTVAEYLKVGAELKGKMGPLGAARVRSDLLWNLNKGMVKLVDRNGNDL